jgi:hypothetical protein
LYFNLHVIFTVLKYRTNFLRSHQLRALALAEGLVRPQGLLDALVLGRGVDVVVEELADEEGAVLLLGRKLEVGVGEHAHRADELCAWSGSTTCLAVACLLSKS